MSPLCKDPIQFGANFWAPQLFQSLLFVLISRVGRGKQTRRLVKISFNIQFDWPNEDDDYDHETRKKSQKKLSSIAKLSVSGLGRMFGCNGRQMFTSFVSRPATCLPWASFAVTRLFVRRRACVQATKDRDQRRQINHLAVQLNRKHPSRRTFAPSPTSGQYWVEYGALHTPPASYQRPELAARPPKWPPLWAGSGARLSGPRRGRRARSTAPQGCVYGRRLGQTGETSACR